MGRRRNAEVYGRLLPLCLDVDLGFLLLARLTVGRRTRNGGGESKEILGPSHMFAGKAAARGVPRSRMCAASLPAC